MQTGYLISGTAHVLFLAVLMFGGLFARDRLPPVAVADVTVISAEEFAALTAPQAAPELETEVTEPPAPEVEVVEEPEVVEEAPPELAALPETSAPELPDTSQPTLPEEPSQGPTVETDTGPTVVAPPVFDNRPDAPEETTPAPADRVAPEPAAPAPPLVESAPEVVEDTAPAPDAAEPQEVQEAAAPEEATTEIVTEAEEQAEAAPAAAPRPRSRPNRPTPVETAEVEEPEPAPEPEVVEEPADDLAESIAAAVAAAATENAPSTPAPAPSGPPLNAGEREAFRVSVSRCWVVDVGSQAADVTVTVGVDMNPDGTVAGNQVRLVEASGGDETAQRAAYDAARRAILRCQSSGFPLPTDKYDHWREIEMTFNPEGMRLK